MLFKHLLIFVDIVTKYLTKCHLREDKLTLDHKQGLVPLTVGDAQQCRHGLTDSRKLLALILHQESENLCSSDPPFLIFTLFVLHFPLNQSKGASIA